MRTEKNRLYCNNCGSNTESTDNHCTNCGNNLQNQTVEQVKISLAPQTDLESGDYTIETSEFSIATKLSYMEKYGFETRINVIKNEDYTLLNTYIIRDHIGKISYKIVKTSKLRSNYTIYDENDLLIGELKGNKTIIESQTQAKSKLSFSYKKEIGIGIKTPTDNITGNYALTDKDYIINLYNQPNNLTLKVTTPRRLNSSSINPSDKSKMMIIGTIRSNGQLSPFLVCTLGFAMHYELENKNLMRYHEIPLLNKTTEIFVNRSKGMLGNSYIFSDVYGTELLRGKRKKLSKTISLVDSSGQQIGTVVECGGLLSLLNSKYTITEIETQRETTIDLRDLSFKIENETFTFGASRNDVYDSEGNLVFTILGWSNNFKLDVKKKFTTNFWCMFASMMMPFFVTQSSSGGGGG